MKISILTPDVSNNCFGRAWLLAKLLEKSYSVEVVGPNFGNGVWSPVRGSCKFKIKTVKGYENGWFEFRKLLKLITGDVIYSSKPLLSSFGAGIIKKLGSRKPLILDIDDWQLGFGKEFYNSLNWLKKLNDYRLSISNFRSYYYTLFIENFIPYADEITVSGKFLKEKYGGTIIWHSRKTNSFSNKNFKRIELKRKFISSNSEDVFLVGFIGTPRSHKGLEDLITALNILKNEKIFGCIIGISEDEYSTSLKKMVKDFGLQDKITLLKEQPFEKISELLSEIDLIVIPQRERYASYGQIPAKIFDAMAMAKPIIATGVYEIPKILDGCAWIVEPENVKQLAETIRYVYCHPDEARKMGWKAFQKCRQEFSWDVLQDRLKSIFEKYKIA